MIEKKSITWIWAILYLIFLPLLLTAQKQRGDYWQISSMGRIVWNLSDATQLPHSENIEMSGKKVSAIIHYDVDSDGLLSLNRDIIFPQLRTYNKADEPDWKKYRAYFRRNVASEVTPLINVNNQNIRPRELDSIAIDGRLTFYHRAQQGLQVTRSLYPSMEGRFLVEKWTIKNLNDGPQEVSISSNQLTSSEIGYKGTYRFEAFVETPESTTLQPQESIEFAVYFGATINEQSRPTFDYKVAEKERKLFLTEMKSNLRLTTPDPVVNTLFYFSKIRASESIFESSLGLIHSPGGGNYYVGIWANDQVEYSGPFFPYLGYGNGNTAAYNTYKKFLQHIPIDDGHIPYAFEVNGNFPMTHLDRGDAAMIAYGLSHYLLARGSERETAELLPLLTWSLAYCHKHRNAAGAVISESDEMEGRISTGTANLSTSALYYGGLVNAKLLANAMERKDLEDQYEQRKSDMALVIEDYFGSELEGLQTYKYFEENKFLRHWICLPLCMRITTRKEGTIKALFDKMWTPDGILVELNPSNPQTVYWDRATLYALQGAMKVGATEQAYDKLKSFSRNRLLGAHVPYVVEAFPENDMKHLSAESALYCRIYTEGMVGIKPTGTRQLSITPTLPSEWNNLTLEALHIFDTNIDIAIEKTKSGISTIVKENGKLVLSEEGPIGTSYIVKLD